MIEKFPEVKVMVITQAVKVLRLSVVSWLKGRQALVHVGS